MKKILFILITGLLLGFYSCEENRDHILYDGPNYVSFIKASTDVFATVGEVSEIPLEIGVTTSSATDRTYTVEIVASGSTAVEGEHFTIDSKTITIPAGKFNGNAIISPIPEALPLAGVTVKFKLVAQDTAMYSIMTHTMKIGKYCELDLDAFVGEYTVDDGYDQGTCTISRDPEDLRFGLIVTDILSYWVGPGKGGKLKIKLNECNQSVSFSKQATGAIHPTYGEISMTPTANPGNFDSETKEILITATHTVSAGSFGAWPVLLTKNTK